MIQLRKMVYGDEHIIICFINYRANVLYIVYRPQLSVSLAPKEDPKFLACCVLSENLPQFDFREFPHHPLETNTPIILNGFTSKNLVDLNQVSMEARQLVHLYLST
jgi:hypothetical protein